MQAFTFGFDLSSSIYIPGINQNPNHRERQRPRSPPAVGGLPCPSQQHCDSHHQNSVPKHTGHDFPRKKGDHSNKGDVMCCSVLLTLGRPRAQTEAGQSRVAPGTRGSSGRAAEEGSWWKQQRSRALGESAWKAPGMERITEPSSAGPASGHPFQIFVSSLPSLVSRCSSCSVTPDASTEGLQTGTQLPPSPPNLAHHL